MMSRPRSPDSHNPPSQIPGTVQYMNGAAYVSDAWVLTNADLNWKIGPLQ
jgi:hypothetical protein